MEDSTGKFTINGSNSIWDFYRCTVHSVVYLITHTHTHTYIYIYIYIYIA